ncbi:Assembly factor CBP4 [Kluyveromyces marxianus]|uniref:Cytochrome b mRNA-processing protein 4 n=2 Tax=Kluyveromyces marxianus TaxID=4911 RepID=W0T7W0_KLUMD|nr:assembly factor CBP4 [Kluyveromyces marxianus DMKU3-1042]KAG0678773.1 assembly factor cbp4 [Kluyveromyces marxianus]KAG0685655.1 assembly factor cbp4 [Kluyveromyces marxianus]QGN15217.1 assembly factor CBP4 [Kluyveromyces marxianus]BAO39500.1 assembly factor CBP4 [Kluyveromyces marxianus DMKU3-1042]BAP70997.1 assembly factor CBP4 [Kluyveromyces marxianus]
MSSSGFLRWGKVFAAGGSIVLAGVLLFKYTTPTDEQLIQALSPELRLQYERERNLRQAEQQELMKIVQQTMKSNDPIWKSGSVENPWEKDNGSRATKDQFQRMKADQVQKEELERIRQELGKIRTESLNETDKIVSKKSWWSLW